MHDEVNFKFINKISLNFLIITLFHKINFSKKNLNKKYMLY